MASGKNNKGVITKQECLDCALANGTPPCGFDYTLLKYIYSKERYMEQKVHVSDILDCPRKAYFSKKFKLPIEPHKQLIVTFGTLQHQMLEEMEDEYYHAEKILSNSGIVGTTDAYYKDGRIVDYKCSLPTDRINMADGTEKIIFDLKVGDKVLAYNELDNSFVESTVSDIFNGGTQEVFNIKIRDGNEINVSGNHPIMTQQGWVVAKELTVFDKVVKLSNNNKKSSKNITQFSSLLSDVVSVTSLGILPTIAIEVDKYHTYITSDIVTHNTTRNIDRRYLPRDKHKMQVNIYAHLLREEGYPVTSAAIQYIDFMGPSKCPKHKAFVVPGNTGPKCPICGLEQPDFHLGAMMLEVELLPPEEVAELVKEKTAYLQNALDNEIIPEPTPDFLCRYCPFVDWCQEGKDSIYI